MKILGLNNMYESYRYPYTIRETAPAIQYILLRMWQPPHMKSEGNYVGSVVGNMGTGKSLGALFFAWMVDVNPRTDVHNFTIDNYIFKLDDFLQRVKNPDHIGESFIMDEMELQAHARNSFAVSNRVLGDIISTFRCKREIVLYTLPTERQLDSQLRSLRKGRFKFYGEPASGYSTFTYHNLDPIVTYDKTSMFSASQECIITVPKIKYKDKTTKVLGYKLYLPNRKDFLNLIDDYKKKKIEYLDEVYDELTDRIRSAKKEDTKSNDTKTIEDYASSIETNISNFLDSNGKFSISKIQKGFNLSERKAIMVSRELKGRLKTHQLVTKDIDKEKAMFDLSRKRNSLEKINPYN